jgi:hypothetical protein
VGRDFALESYFALFFPFSNFYAMYREAVLLVNKGILRIGPLTSRGIKPPASSFGRTLLLDAFEEVVEGAWVA